MSNIDLLSRYTYSDYLLWEGDWELIKGFPVSMAPAPMRIHQQIARELFIALNQESLEECEDEKVAYYILVYPDDLKAKVYSITDIQK